MTISVRMNPLLEKELELTAKRQGVTKSQFIIDAVERALGRKNPYDLLLQVREEFAPYNVCTEGDAASSGTAEPLSTDDQFRSILQSKHEAQTRDWLAFQAAKANPGTQANSQASESE